jgi:hypothetical protein
VCGVWACARGVRRGGARRRSRTGARRRPRRSRRAAPRAPGADAAAPRPPAPKQARSPLRPAVGAELCAGACAAGAWGLRPPPPPPPARPPPTDRSGARGRPPLPARRRRRGRRAPTRPRGARRPSPRARPPPLPCQMGLGLISIGFVGHMGDPLALSQVVLANSLFNITGAVRTKSGSRCRSAAGTPLGAAGPRSAARAAPGRGAGRPAPRGGAGTRQAQRGACPLTRRGPAHAFCLARSSCRASVPAWRRFAARRWAQVHGGAAWPREEGEPLPGRRAPSRSARPPATPPALIPAAAPAPVLPHAPPPTPPPPGTSAPHPR